MGIYCIFISLSLYLNLPHFPVFTNISLPFPHFLSFILLLFVSVPNSIFKLFHVEGVFVGIQWQLNSG
jgi:uncharacterized protein (DUF983 family)